MNYFSSTWFKVSLGIVVLMFLYGVVAYFLVNKKRASSLPVEERMRLAQALPKAFSICKLVIFFAALSIFTPLNLQVGQSIVL
jgi:hypothetical protein